MFTFPVAHFGGGVDFTIDQAIRFNDDDSAYLSRTPGSAGNRRTFTFSCWVKRANIIGSNCPILSAGGDEWLMFLSGDTLGFNQDGSANYRIVTTQLFRDPGAWFHLVLRVDTTNATAGDRFRLYINGSEVTDFNTDTNPPLNYDTAINNTGEHNIGKLVGSSVFFDGYLAEIHHVDGSSLGPDSFGETNDDGVWIPKKPSGLSYGTTGFHIDGSNSSDLGEDQVGSNDWTSNNLAAADSVSDSPTDNHCTLNSLDGAGTLSDGNLVNAATGSSFVNRRMTFGVPSSGKWAFRVKKSANNFMVGVIAPQETDGDPDQNNIDAVFYYDEDGTSSGDIQTRRSGSKVVETTDAPAGIAADTFMEVLIDKDNNRLGVVIGGTAYVAVDSGVAIQNTMTQIFVATAGSGVTATVDFGQSGFTPSQTGYKALSTANLPAPAIADPSAHFQTTLYTGNGSTQSITNAGNSDLQPDLIWIKNRSAADNNVLTDAVRGATKIISSDATTTEATDADTVTAFASDGFALGDDDKVNTSSENYVAWQWKAGGGSGSTNEDGSVDSTVSVNTTAGFSICKFNPGGNSNITFGHGLGTAPRLVLVKDLEDATNWQVLHLDQGVGNKLFLNSTNAVASDANMWQNTAPSSTVVSVGTAQTANEQYIAYCFAEIEGFSKFGSYVGNGSATAAPFIWTGFRPALVVVKNITNSGDAWPVADAARSPFNVANATVFWNQTTAETTGYSIDLLSNGFRPFSSDDGINESAATFIYAAFAESPFKTSLAR